MDCTIASHPPAPEQSPRAEVLAKNAASIRQLGRRVIGDVIEIGRLLSECKALLGHGNWLPWLSDEFSWSERTARNFIQAYEFALSTSANVADLKLEVSSLYLLAAKTTPQEVRVEVLRRAGAGEDLPHAEIKSMVCEARERKAVASRRITPGEVIERLG